MEGKGGQGVKNFFPDPNELLIWVRVRVWVGFGSVQSDYIENLSLGFGLALAEAYQ